MGRECVGGRLVLEGKWNVGEVFYHRRRARQARASLRRACEEGATDCQYESDESELIELAHALQLSLGFCMYESIHGRGLLRWWYARGHGRDRCRTGGHDDGETPLHC